MGTSAVIQFCEKKKLKEVLQIHNDYRKIHSSPPLILNDALSKIAEEVANHLINDKNDNLDDSLFIYKNHPLGVNIYTNKNHKSPEEICKEWYNENKNYKYDIDKFQKNTIHFTQMVWKNTKEVGFVFTTKKGKKCCGIALYYPAGNIFDEFKENVIKPK